MVKRGARTLGLAAAIALTTLGIARRPSRRRRQGSGGQDPAPAQAPLAGPRPRRGASGDRAAAADLPCRDQLRPRRRHRHRQQGQPGPRPDAHRLRGHRGRHAADGRVLQADQGGRASRRPRRRARSAPPSTRSRRPQREDVRLFAIFLDDYHVRRGAALYARQPLASFLRMQLRPSRHGGAHVPADAAERPRHVAQPRGDGARGGAVRRPQVRLHPAQPCSRSSTRATRRRRWSASATRCRSRRSARS